MEGMTFKRIRLALGYTGDQLASRLNVSGNYIRLVETNKKPVSELLEYKIMEQLKQRYYSDDPLFDILKNFSNSQSSSTAKREAANDKKQNKIS